MFASFAPPDNTPCVVRDLSTAGAGLEWFGRQAGIGDRVLLDLRLGPDRRASIRLRGEVRHASADEQGLVRVGIEFFETGTLEQTLLVRLLDDQRRAEKAG
jgi:hypothetical protein